MNNNLLDNDEEGLEKKFMSEIWINHSKNIEIQNLKNSLISFKVLYQNQQIYEDYCTENVIEHVFSKKNLFNSKNSKKLVRKGVPIKYIRNFLLKLLLIEIDYDDYQQKFQTVFKSFDTSQLGDNLPCLNNSNVLTDSLKIDYLNENGIKALKETMWIIDSIFNQINFSPIIINIASIVLLFCNKIETYFIIRTLIERDVEAKDLFRLRWHFRFSENENCKIVSSIMESLIQITKTAKSVFNHLDKINFPVNRLFEDMIYGFFLDYLNFEAVIRLLPIFLVEGVKSLYRLSYAILKMTREKILESMSADDIIRVTRMNAKAITDIDRLFKLAFSYGLTRYNNKFDYKTNLNDTISQKTLFYLPNLNTNSSILKQNELIYLWTILPDKFKQRDPKMIFNSEIQGNSLQTIYSLNSLNKKDSSILFLIETTKNEVFGGVFSNLFQINSKYEKPNIAILYSIRPKFLIFENNFNHDEVLYCSDISINIGNGPNGPAITIDQDLSVGKTNARNCFEFHLFNNSHNFEILRMEIFSLL